MDAVENPDRFTDPMLAEVDKILVAIEANYGLSRSEAISCLKNMAYALEVYRPGDEGLREAFVREVEDSANDFQHWAIKVGQNVFGWEDCT